MSPAAFLGCVCEQAFGDVGGNTSAFLLLACPALFSQCVFKPVWSLLTSERVVPWNAVHMCRSLHLEPYNMSFFLCETTDGEESEH